jgi:hypothetical protein
MVLERDATGKTGFELTECLLDEPTALAVPTKERLHDGKGCASAEELKVIVKLLEQSVATDNKETDSISHPSTEET